MGKRGKTFGSKLYSMFIGSILIPALIAILCFWVYSTYVTVEREEKNIQNILDSVSQNIELQLLDIRNIEESFYINGEVFQEAEALNNHKLSEAYDVLKQIQLQENYEMTLTKMIHTSSQNIRAVTFFPMSEGETGYYLSKNRSDLQETEYPGYHGEKWFYEAVTSPTVPFFSRPDGWKGQGEGTEKTYSYVKAVRSMDNTSRVIGVVKIDIDRQMLLETLDMFAEADENGLILMQNEENFVSSQWIGEEAEQLGKDKVELDGAEYQIHTQDIPNTGLTIGFIESRASLYMGYAVIILISILILAAGVALAFVNYRWQAKKMVADVSKITNVVQLVEKGELDTHIRLGTDSEFRKIAEVINQMIDNLKEYIEKQYLLVIQQQKAEYKALQSQINPHFLYNTLNGFVALNRMGEKEALEQGIVELSHLFRYAYSSREFVPVREEMRFLEDYLKLEKLKCDGRLDYIIWLDKNCAGKEIPKLLLQPIVENSIRHGMGNTNAPILIRILAETAEVRGIGRVIILTVRDNGAGFDIKSTKKKDGDHVGVDNVRARAELYCREAVFQCISKPGEGTKTTIVFPDRE
mgnify:CR=1 FL=1